MVSCSQCDVNDTYNPITEVYACPRKAVWMPDWTACALNLKAVQVCVCCETGSAALVEASSDSHVSFDSLTIVVYCCVTACLPG